MPCARSAGQQRCRPEHLQRWSAPNLHQAPPFICKSSDGRAGVQGRQDEPSICLLCLSSTPRLMLEFDLLIFSFGQLPLALVTWVPMFLSTLLAPYQALRLWARPRASAAWMLGVGLGCALLAAHTAVLGLLPLHVAVEYQLPPASRCILVFEQVRAGARVPRSGEPHQGSGALRQRAPNPSALAGRNWGRILGNVDETDLLRQI